MAESITIRAPEFPKDLVWLNTPRPLSLRELRGQLVILDFWTYCCVNCMHVLPILEALEARHRRDPLVVIGVHSAKFDGERDPSRIADAITRHGITHPVVVDEGLRIWDLFAIRSWPTLVAIRPDGTIGAVAPGEPEPAQLEAFVNAELARARARGILADRPFAIERTARKPIEASLAFPGKVDVAADGRFAVSDSGHHRVLVFTKKGELLATIGSGAPGHRDGTFEEAELDDPQGVRFAPDGHALYVADARAHVVLRADLTDGTVTTIAGTGVLGEGPLGEGARPGKGTPLRSPWDLVLVPGRREGDRGDRLIVALAGSHQIAAIDLATGTIERLAGTGAESMIDGDLAQATFAQPSGLALRGHEIWIADSETSSVRVLDLHRGEVRTVVGAGLFDFGDVDGPPERARLQHDLAITSIGDRIVIADTYNHKLKEIDPRTGDVRTIAHGALREPGGLAWDPSRGALLVADTGHGRIVAVTPDGKSEVVDLRGVHPPNVARDRPPESLRPPLATSWFTVVLDEGAPLSSGEGRLLLDLSPVGELHFAAHSQIRVGLEVSRRSDLVVLPSPIIVGKVADQAPAAAITIPISVGPLAGDVASEIVASLECITCRDGGDGEPAACFPVRARLRLPLRLSPEGGHEARFVIPIDEA
jgi:DNA-binding beta-propeller fold protein YncE